jgi:hypothetical protein
MSETGIKVLEVWLVVWLRLRMRRVLLWLVPRVAMRGMIWVRWWCRCCIMDSPRRKRHASSLDVRRIFVFLRNIIRKITLPLIFFWRGRIIGSLIFPCPVSRFRWSWLVKSLIVSESWCRGCTIFPCVPRHSVSRYSSGRTSSNSPSRSLQIKQKCLHGI